MPFLPSFLRTKPNLVGGRALPYFDRMNSIHIRMGLAALLLGMAGCAIEEVGEQRETGTLVFRARNAYEEVEGISGLLGIAGREALNYPGGDAFLVIEDLPLDSNLVLHFTPSNAEDWFPLDDMLYRFPSGARRDTLIARLYPRADSLLSVVARTMTPSGERAGMPLWLDGVRWPQDSPATLYFTRMASHQLRVGDDFCLRADTSFSYDEDPTSDLLVDAGSVAMMVDPGVDGLLILDGVDLGAGIWSVQDPQMGSYFFSAFRPGHRATPAWVRLGGLCGGGQVFSWTSAAEGYAASQLFPDFTLSQVVPGQSAPIGQYSLHQLRGKLVLVSFWFIACTACQEEMPGFQALLQQYGSRGFRVVAMDPFPTDDPVYFPNYDFIFLQDLGSPPVAQMAQVSAYPTNYVILPDGRIHSVRGGISSSALEALLQELLPE